MANTTKIRHLSASKLIDVESMIEALPSRVEIKGVNFSKGRWYIHFTIGDFQRIKSRTKRR